MSLPLEGLLVADFSRVLAGPLATATLADLGARVVKVERPGSGDDTRSWGPPWVGGPGTSASYFHSANRNKESVTLDLTDDSVGGDLELARELARRADVLVENFRTGALDRFGLGYEQVRRVNPGIVYCSISGFGSGPGAALPGYDFLVQAVGGLMSITGAADGEPTKAGVALVDVLTAKDATAGILAALIARGRSGERPQGQPQGQPQRQPQGQHVEVNLLSSLLAALVNQASSFATTGRSPHRMGNAHPSIAPYELLRASDDFLAVACGNDGQFRRLAAELGDASLADDPRFVTNAARVEHRPELVPALEELLGADTAAGWAKRLADAGVPAGKVGTVEEAFALATALGLEPLVEVDGAPAQVRHPVTYSSTPVTTYTAPPDLGEHSGEIRRWLRGPHDPQPDLHTKEKNQ